MQNTSKVSACLLLTVLIAATTCMYTCASAQIPSRYSNNNEQRLDRSIPEDAKDVSSPTETGGNAKDEIPLDFLKALDNVTDMSEFIQRFVDTDNTDPQLGIQENLKRNVERASVVKPKVAGCATESTSVPLTPLNPSKDPKIFYFPKCTRVKRCSGCCNSGLMSCEATEYEPINFEVQRLIYPERTIDGKEIVVVQQHTQCRCICRIKPEDCNSYQLYRSDLCRCLCTNDDAMKKCLHQDNKIWDEQTCRCTCRDAQSCTTGWTFDENQCMCIDSTSDGTVIPTLLNRRRFIIKAVPVEPNNSTIYTHV